MTKTRKVTILAAVIMAILGIVALAAVCIVGAGHDTKIFLHYVPKKWQGLTKFSGNYIWNDAAGHTFYSNGEKQFQLNANGTAWEVCSWEGIPEDFNIQQIWYSYDENGVLKNTYFKNYRLTDGNRWQLVQSNDFNLFWRDGLGNAYASVATENGKLQDYKLTGETESQLTWTKMTWTNADGDEFDFHQDTTQWYTYDRTGQIADVYRGGLRLMANGTAWESVSAQVLDGTDNHLGTVSYWFDNDANLYYSESYLYEDTYLSCNYQLNTTDLVWYKTNIKIDNELISNIAIDSQVEHVAFAPYIWHSYNAEHHIMKTYFSLSNEQGNFQYEIKLVEENDFPLVPIIVGGIILIVILTMLILLIPTVKAYRAKLTAREAALPEISLKTQNKYQKFKTGTIVYPVLCAVVCVGIIAQKIIFAGINSKNDASLLALSKIIPWVMVGLLALYIILGIVNTILLWVLCKKLDPVRAKKAKIGVIIDWVLLGIIFTTALITILI